MKSGESMAVSIDVQNTGKVTGDQVVQLYTHQRSGSSSRPVRELKGFRRITLKPGERKMVELKLDTNELGFWSPPDTHGRLSPWMGTDSTANEHTTFEVLPQ